MVDQETSTSSIHSTTLASKEYESKNKFTASKGNPFRQFLGQVNSLHHHIPNHLARLDVPRFSAHLNIEREDQMDCTSMLHAEHPRSSKLPRNDKC